ncbi:MAG: LexA repressor [Patescibacteria group bacterium]|nr:MAG: LexA repressor [Patescibacteria group bacterium]
MDQAVFEQRLQKLTKFYIDNKRLPSYSEMCKIFNLRSKNTVYRFCQKLIERDYIRKDEQGKLIPSDKLKPVKLLGYIQAGFPNTTEEETLDTLSLDEFLIKNPQATFMLKISGDSMISAGILPGDYVLVDRTIPPESGMIVIAQVDSKWTIKYFIKNKNKIYLKPANSKYPIIYPKDELIIAGVVTGVVRKYL